MAEEIKIGMAEMVVAHNPARITTIGLGSCVGVVLYDKFAKLGAMAHIMLPSVAIAKKNEPENKAKYADSAIAELLENMQAKGARKLNITAKIFGGANMFHTVIHSKGLLHMGQKNIDSVRQELEKHKVKIVVEEVGGTVGRTITLDTVDGKVYLKTVKGERQEY